MLVDQTVTSLEMTSPSHLRPGRTPPAAVDVENTAALRLIRETHDRVAAPHHWSSLEWTEDRWRELLSRPGVRTWIARVGIDVVGLVQLEAQPLGDVEITKFGLVPEFVGRGFGAHLLTTATRLAWDTEPIDASPIARVWLHTSSLDHPHALHNYRRRGFREFDVRTRQREIP